MAAPRPADRLRVSSIDGFSVSSLVMAQAARQQLTANVVDTLLKPAAAPPTPAVKLDLSPAAQALLADQSG
jgi:hypothetical protein